MQAEVRVTLEGPAVRLWLEARGWQPWRPQLELQGLELLQAGPTGESQHRLYAVELRLQRDRSLGPGVRDVGQLAELALSYVRLQAHELLDQGSALRIVVLPREGQG